MGSVWTCCTHIWSNRGHQGLQRPPRSVSITYPFWQYSCWMGRHYPVQVFTYKIKAFKALHGTCLDLLHTYLVQQGSSGTEMLSWVWLCHHDNSQCFAILLSHGSTLSCAGLFIQIPGFQGTAWDLIWLSARISGPTGVTRDGKNLLDLKVLHILFCNILITWCDSILCRSSHTESRLSKHCMGSVWTCHTQIWSSGPTGVIRNCNASLSLIV